MAIERIAESRTVKGKGVSFMENVAGWRGKSPNHEEMIKGLREHGLARKIPYASW
ncbi:MAG: hypothetical protein WAK27_09325 [Candidatus Sulfotelmatobacter sp.]